MFWVRVDNRLVHGQIIETWLPFTGARLLVVANDQLAADALQQEIVSLAIPGSVKAVFLSVEEVGGALEALMARAKVRLTETLVLFATCNDARRAYEGGVDFSSVNIGNLHYGPGKRQLAAHVAVSAEDENCLRYFDKQGVALDFRCVPNEPVQVRLG